MVFFVCCVLCAKTACSSSPCAIVLPDPNLLRCDIVEVVKQLIEHQKYDAMPSWKRWLRSCLPIQQPKKKIYNKQQQQHQVCSVSHIQNALLIRGVFVDAHHRPTHHSTSPRVPQRSCMPPPVVHEYPSTTMLRTTITITYMDHHHNHHHTNMLPSPSPCVRRLCARVIKCE